MEYKNGAEVLPSTLLEQLQEYVRGELVYIPIPDEDHVGWGCKNGTRKMIDGRNREIFKKHQKGLSVEILASQYNLSHESIRKIIYKSRKMKSRLSAR